MNNKNEFQQIMEKLEKIEAMLVKLSQKKDNRKEEELMDNHDMCAMLGITKRTLQRYRQKGIVPYYMMGGKPYYKLTEVQERLKRILKGNNNLNIE
jgi:aspartate/tyrosine/aromatic aminotransferase